MRKYIIILLLSILPSVLMAQDEVIRRPGKKTQTFEQEPKKLDSKKKGNKNQTTKKQEPEKRESSNHAPEALGYDVSFSCNVPSATLVIDSLASVSAIGTWFLKTGSHNIRLTANGYVPLSQTITVSRSSTSFSFSMKQIENKLSPVLQNLVNNMVCVEGGTFTMGATLEQLNYAYDFEKPAHQVTLNSFSIGKYEVTQEEWQVVMGSNPSYFKGAKRPVERVSWNDCQEFIRKLNQMTGKRFRLPTEAEWEYAARGGNHSIGYMYSGSNSPFDVAWYDGNSGKETHPVGQKSPNELGLYDMSGNVWEWCQDWHGDYSSSSQTNPTGATSGFGRVYRGGSWNGSVRGCRSSQRNLDAPSGSDGTLGLRLAL